MMVQVEFNLSCQRNLMIINILEFEKNSLSRSTHLCYKLKLFQLEMQNWAFNFLGRRQPILYSQKSLLNRISPFPHKHPVALLLPFTCEHTVALLLPFPTEHTVVLLLPFLIEHTVVLLLSFSTESSIQSGWWGHTSQFNCEGSFLSDFSNPDRHTNRSTWWVASQPKSKKEDET